VTKNVKSDGKWCRKVTTVSHRSLVGHFRKPGEGVLGILRRVLSAKHCKGRNTGNDGMARKNSRDGRRCPALFFGVRACLHSPVSTLMLALVETRKLISTSSLDI
jgi:hypothetical protein